jgi:hypothetical protein
MTKGKIVALPHQRRSAVRMTKEQSEWYRAGRIDSLIEAMGHTPTWQSSAGKRPGAPGGPAEFVPLRLRRKRKPSGTRRALEDAL